MKRREFITALGGAAAWPLGARAEQSQRIRRVGVLMSFSPRAAAAGDPHRADRVCDCPDPVGAGFVDSLARPGGNATGLTSFEYGLSAKWLELLKEVMRNAPEVVREVGIDDFRVAMVQQRSHLDHRLLSVAPGTVGILFWWKVGFEDRFQHQHRCRHADPSRKVEMPSGRSLPLVFGMYTLLIGAGR